MSTRAVQRYRWGALGLLLASLALLGCVALETRPTVTGPAPPSSTAVATSPGAGAKGVPPAAASAGPPSTQTPTAAPPAEPAPTPDGQVRTADVPILMYHYISDPPPEADAYRLDLSVGPPAFEAQLAYLQEAGYTSITLTDLVQHLATGQPLPPRPVVLTFDDGYIDHYTQALPLLRRYGFRGTFFVITSFLDEGRSGYISWEQAELMQRAGMEIGAHSATHPDLRGLGPEELHREVAGAGEAIEAHLSKPARFFCYPSGHYDGQTIEALRAAGYWGAVTTEYGADHSSAAPFELARIRVHGQAALEDFKAIMERYTG